MARRTTGAALVVLVALAATLVVVRTGAEDAERRPRAADAAEPAKASVRPVDRSGSSSAARPRERPTSLALARRLTSRFHLEITSGYRSPAHNAAVGGVARSFHTRGTRSNPGAVDLAGTRIDMRRARAWALRHVPNLAEAMVHAVCLLDEQRPWRVADGGMHLHLAFAVPASGDTHVDLSAGSGERGCPTPMDRFEMAVDAIEQQRADRVLTETRAARFTIRATTRALTDEDGRLVPRDRRSIVAARRAAQKTIGRARAARRREQRKHDAYQRYLVRLDEIAEREVGGELSHGQAAAVRKAIIASALSGKYGPLTASQRALVLADRTTLTEEPATTAPVDPPATTAPDSTASPPATTTAPVTTPAVP